MDKLNTELKDILQSYIDKTVEKMYIRETEGKIETLAIYFTNGKFLCFRLEDISSVPYIHYGESKSRITMVTKEYALVKE